MMSDASAASPPAMAKKKGAAKPKGRPRSGMPLKSLLSLKASDDYEAWLDELVEHARLGTRSLLVRNAVREFAEKHGFRPPPRR